MTRSIPSSLPAAPSDASAPSRSIPRLLGPWLALGVGLGAMTTIGDTESSRAAAAAEAAPIVRAVAPGAAAGLRIRLVPTSVVSTAGGLPTAGQLLDLDDLLAPTDPSDLPAPAQLDRLFSVTGHPVKELPPGYRHHLLDGTPPPEPAVAAAPGDPTPEQWHALRQCESSNNYGAVNRTGKYRGAYQFDVTTWQAVGGAGDPAAATPGEQDKRALLLYQRRGAAPWPVCGRHLR